MHTIRKICVYCGSSKGADPAFIKAACHFGRILAENDIGLVYGGGDLGLMGAIAHSVLGAGGHVTGIIPHFLQKQENMLESVQELIVVDDMHERKRLMFEKADAFVALPGGIGTLEELVEQLTWVQLQRHDKPVLIADIAGFWKPLLSLLEHMRDQGFIRVQSRGALSGLRPGRGDPAGASGGGRAEAGAAAVAAPGTVSSAGSVVPVEIRADIAAVGHRRPSSGRAVRSARPCAPPGRMSPGSTSSIRPPPSTNARPGPMSRSTKAR